MVTNFTTKSFKTHTFELSVTTNRTSDDRWVTESGHEADISTGYFPTTFLRKH